MLTERALHLWLVGCLRPPRAAIRSPNCCHDCAPRFWRTCWLGVHCGGTRGTAHGAVMAVSGERARGDRRHNQRSCSPTTPYNRRLSGPFPPVLQPDISQTFYSPFHRPSSQYICSSIFLFSTLSPPFFILQSSSPHLLHYATATMSDPYRPAYYPPPDQQRYDSHDYSNVDQYGPLIPQHRTSNASYNPPQVCSTPSSLPSSAHPCLFSVFPPHLGLITVRHREC